MNGEGVVRSALRTPTNRDPLASSRGVLSWLLTCLVLGAAGCSDGRPPRVTVSGQVLIDGQPLQQGSVQFIPKGGRPAVGKIDENGRFTLSTYDTDDGVVLGVHQVAVNASEYLSAKKKKWHAPKKYATFRTTPLTQEITGSVDSLEINLTWDGGKPFVERVK